MKKMWLALILLYAGTAQAGDISGTVTILEKNGTGELKSFANAVVFVKNLEAPAPAGPAVMDQRDKTFLPRLLPVVRGQEVRFLNSDPIQHNVFSPHAEEPFDLGRYPTGEYRSFVFRTPGRHKIYCNIHQKMISDVFVLPNPYFAVTDGKGAYRISGVPEGEYVIRVWHIFGGAEEKTATVGSGATALDFRIRSTKIIRELEEHPGKDGKGYEREAYDPGSAL